MCDNSRRASDGWWLENQSGRTWQSRQWSFTDWDTEKQIMFIAGARIRSDLSHETFSLLNVQHWIPNLVIRNPELRKGIILWLICPLLGNGSVNTFPNHTLSTIEGHPLLGNGPINTNSWQQKTVFSVGSVPRSYKRVQSEELKVVQRSSGVVHLEVRIISVESPVGRRWQCVR
jgi:hypothetical protein